MEPETITTKENTLALPSPPTISQISSASSCKFHYLLTHERLCIKKAYNVISKNEWWEPFREELLLRGVDKNTGFMMNTNPLYNKIMDAIIRNNSGHSGCSIAITMRIMEFIALNGELDYLRSE